MTKEQIIKRISYLEDSISDKESIIEDAEMEIQQYEEEEERLEKQLEDAESDIIGNLYMYLCTNQPLYLQFIQEELGEYEELDEESQLRVDLFNIPLVLA